MVSIRTSKGISFGRPWPARAAGGRRDLALPPTARMRILRFRIAIGQSGSGWRRGRPTSPRARRYGRPQRLHRSARKATDAAPLDLGHELIQELYSPARTMAISALTQPPTAISSVYFDMNVDFKTVDDQGAWRLDRQYRRNHRRGMVYLNSAHSASGNVGNAFLAFSWMENEKRRGLCPPAADCQSALLAG